MKTKLEMAHEYAIALINSDSEMQFDKFIRLCWQYADAMQAEADKREKEEAAQRRKKIREMPNAPNTFVEREGQHFDDVEEWQPDWSQAPDNDVQYFAVDEDGRGGWFISKPTLCSDHWYWSDFEERVDNDNYDHAPSFGYSGDWRNSLRKRPK